MVGLRDCDRRQRRLRRACDKSQTPANTDAHDLGEWTHGTFTADFSRRRMVVMEEDKILLSRHVAEHLAAQNLTASQ